VGWLGKIGEDNFLSRSVIEHRRKIAMLCERGKLVHAMPYRWADRRTLSRAVGLLGSSSGCRIFPAESAGLMCSGFFELRRPAYLWAQVVDCKTAPDGGWRYRLALRDGDELRDIAEDVCSYQRYDIGGIVRLTGTPAEDDNHYPRLIDPTLPYTPGRRNMPDGVHAIQVLSQSVCGSPALPAPERRRALITTARRLRIAR